MNVHHPGIFFCGRPLDRGTNVLLLCDAGVSAVGGPRNERPRVYAMMPATTAQFP